MIAHVDTSGFPPARLTRRRLLRIGGGCVMHEPPAQRSSWCLKGCAPAAPAQRRASSPPEQRTPASAASSRLLRHAGEFEFSLTEQMASGWPRSLRTLLKYIRCDAFLESFGSCPCGGATRLSVERRVCALITLYQTLAGVVQRLNGRRSRERGLARTTSSSAGSFQPLFRSSVPMTSSVPAAAWRGKQ